MILLQSRAVLQGNLSSSFIADASIILPLPQLFATEVHGNLTGSYHAHNIDLI